VVAVVATGAAASAFALNVTGDDGTDEKSGRRVGTRQPPATTAPAPTTTTVPPPAPVPSSAKTLQLVNTINGDISPKSVVASGTGVVFAQNMMYKHSITVYDRDGNLVNTIPDDVSLDAFGIPGHPGVVRGAPVEAAFSPDARYAYVSNYSMYGAGFGPEGTDTCSPSSGYSSSFVYRVDVAQLVIDKAIEVGAVPKYVAVTPDNRYVLNSNWCSYDLSVIDANAGTQVARVQLGAYPRGIAVDPTSTTAYVAVMGSRDIAKVDLATFNVDWIRNVGSAPRHVVMDPTGQFLYVTLNADGQVAKIDVTSGEVVAKVSTGSEPRSMAIAADGLSLYVVNYESNTVSKLAADDLRLLQSVPTPSHPIGITYDAPTSRVWVASYAGSILVYDDA
jgi:YVTN family beta-propeller protein